MIHRLGSDLASFKTLTFRPGLNVLLADKSEGASDRQSRNGAGKTSFVELLHFLFGGRVDPKSIFRSAALQDSTFDALVDVGPKTLSVARSGKKPSAVRVSPREQLSVDQMELTLTSGDDVLRNEDWGRILGNEWFSLPKDGEDRPFKPTFRSLFSLFARRHFAGGFESPTQHTTKQQIWDRQVSTSYLLGLEWTISSRFQELREKEKSLKALRAAVRSGDLGRYLGRVPELRTQLTLADSNVERLRHQHAAFEVVPQYAELEQEANQLTEEIGRMAEQNVTDQALIHELRSALDVEAPPALDHLAALYREAGVILPDLIHRRLTDVQTFHRAIVEKSAHTSRRGDSERPATCR